MAIILTAGRPAICFENGKLGPMPTMWGQLEERRELLEGIARQVGILTIEGHPQLGDIGTAFLVGRDLAMTASFMVDAFAEVQSPLKIAVRKGLTVRVRFPTLDGRAAPCVSAVVFKHPFLSVAALRLSWGSGQGAAANSGSGLRLAARAPRKLGSIDAAVVSYAAFDLRNDPEAMRASYGDLAKIGRLGCLFLQPGRLIAAKGAPGEPTLVSHDCTTVGGSGGAPLIDTKTGVVLGVHYAGKPLSENHAVAVWALARDRHVRNAEVLFSDDPSWMHLWSMDSPVAVPSGTGRPAERVERPDANDIQEIFKLLSDIGLIEPSSFRCLLSTLDPEVVANLPADGPPGPRALAVISALCQLPDLRDGSSAIVLFLRTAALVGQAFKESDRLAALAQRFE